ncbi:hypothetical protein FJP62_14375 [Pantoea vagans]|nr:hypothetical protein FJP62_14375 [Pantoea vagans]
MDRQIVYPGAIPLETDLLNTNKFAMTGMAKLAMAVLGSDTCLYGLHCTPDSPASMRVIVGSGQIYSLQNTDNTPYSSLPADTSQLILKQGLICEATPLTLIAPASAGHSMNYLVQVGYEDVDSDETVLPYYNAANPAVAYSGPGNSGKAQPGKRSGVCRLMLKAGVSSPTGSQITPQPDAGYVAAWGITVTAGMNAITEASIFRIEGAPFLPDEGIITAVQQGRLNNCKTRTEGDNYHLFCQPPVTQLTDGMRLFFRTAVTNTGPCKLRVGDLPVYPVYDNAARELIKGTLSICHQNEVEWNATLNAWILCNHQQQVDWDDFNKRFISVSGGEITGDLTVEGSLSTEKALKVGESELIAEGDIKGKTWGGSLQKWLINRSASFLKGDGYLVWKDPVSHLIIQGGHRSGAGDIGFHTTFPSKCLTVLITQSGKKGQSKDNSFVDNVSTQKFTLHAGKGEPSFYWLAMGY